MGEWNIGDYSAAQVHAIEAQRLAIISADLYKEAEALEIEATCCYTLGNYVKAMSLCIRARDLLGLCGMSHGGVDHYIMNTQGEVHMHKSEYIEAHSINTSILEATSIQDPYNSDLHLREGNSLAAKTSLQGVQNDSGIPQITTYCLERLGDASCWGNLDGMCSWTTIYLVNSLKTKEKLGIFKALRSLGDIFLYQNNEHTAISLFTVALEGFTEMDVHRSRAECMLRLGDISMEHSDPLKAVEFWERARPLFERSSQAKQVQHINERLAGIGNDVLEQHRNSLACLAELNAPAGTVEELEDDLSDIDNLDQMDMGEEKELGLIVA
ncbi:hypothetical protein B0H13DRAFT_1899152 [Mycena leptocephala]|nr:hypothetical protein B0H13DRAFT_1899152 [Mycena leptocephala]